MAPAAAPMPPPAAIPTGTVIAVHSASFELHSDGAQSTPPISAPIAPPIAAPFHSDGRDRFGANAVVVIVNRMAVTIPTVVRVACIGIPPEDCHQIAGGVKSASSP